MTDKRLSAEELREHVAGVIKLAKEGWALNNEGAMVLLDHIATLDVEIKRLERERETVITSLLCIQTRADQHQCKDPNPGRPRNGAQACRWIASEATGLLTLLQADTGSGNPKPSHVCGLQGYDPTRDETCPACVAAGVRGGGE